MIPVVAGILAMPARVHTAELQARTSRAYDEYAEAARRTFVERASAVNETSAQSQRAASAGPGHDDGIIGVPGGLVHHWRGSAFMRGVNQQQALATSRDYASYPSIYRAVTSARIVEDRQDTSRVLMRLHESAGGLSAVLEVRSTIQHIQVGPARAYSIATLDEIREVKDAGTSSERLLPPGRDSGYLWRGGTFTLFVEADDGVYVEMHTLALSRAFPPMMGWIIAPIARRLGRGTMETTLREFQAAVIKRSRSGAGAR